MASLIDHVFINVTNVKRSLAFYQKVLAPIGITGPLEWEAKGAHPNHPIVYGFGRANRHFLWIKLGSVHSPSHFGLACKSEKEVDACYEIAVREGAKPDEVYGGAPSLRPYYGIEYYAGSILDPDGNEVEFTYKKSQHPSPGTD
ncbi:glyoxalase bleomycin resistance dioxygenase [Fusarium pseudocircinatum]|uniref:Glyoxalase bleomycin resistance dioxygenase n=1 Tax=Fusarium pseudocircinatum TaxID=56676 RepID=A0A8H5KJV5_9HYPO|nr:glyoxalase bleomycin resistance dioxygenase [Fusarium pseudocircinatum]